MNVKASVGSKQEMLVIIKTRAYLQKIMDTSQLVAFFFFFRHSSLNLSTLHSIQFDEVANAFVFAFNCSQPILKTGICLLVLIIQLLQSLDFFAQFANI